MIGGLEDWRIGGLEDWRIGRLSDVQFLILFLPEANTSKFDCSIVHILKRFFPPPE
jgi:hypothetical protein